MPVEIKRKAKQEPQQTPAQLERAFFRAWYLDYFGTEQEPPESLIEIYLLGVGRGLEKAARMHATYAAQAPKGTGRAYNHSVYADNIRALYPE